MQNELNHRKSILVVEDEKSIFETIEFAFKKELYNVSHASNASEALAKIKINNFNFIILDVGLPDLDGFELCKRIRKNSEVPIIFLTARNEEIEKILGLELGADDYITKPFSTKELVARVKTVLRRFTPDERVVERNEGDWFIDSERAQIVYQKKILNLSKYEFNIMQVLLKRKGKVFSRSELMDRAWEDPGMSMERTVDAHVKSIRSKLKKICPDEDLIITHRGFGYSIKE